MKRIQGDVTNALWPSSTLSDLPPARPDFRPVWGLSALADNLAPPPRDGLVLITGNEPERMSALARTIALHNAARGMMVESYVGGIGNDERDEAVAYVSAALGTPLRESTGTIHGATELIDEIPGSITLYEGRPSILPHEDTVYPADLVVCDPVNDFLSIDDSDISRAVVLERLKIYARKHDCLVVAVSHNEDHFPIDWLAAARGWEIHADVHLELHTDDDEEDMADTIWAKVIRDGGQWADTWVTMADQCAIGRLGDFTAPEPETGEDSEIDDLLALLRQASASPAEELSIDADSYEAQVSRAVTRQFESDPAAFLRSLSLLKAFEVQGESLDVLEFSVLDVDWELNPPRQPMFDMGDGAVWEAEVSTYLRVQVAGRIIQTSVELHGPMITWLTREGTVVLSDCSAMLTPQGKIPGKA